MCKKISNCKKLTSLALTITLVIVCTISSAITTSLAYTLPSVGTISYMKSFYENNTEVVDKVIEGINNMETRIDIRDYNLTPDSAWELILIAFKTHPEFFYLANKYSYSYNPNSGIMTAISPKYTCTAEEAETMRAELDIEVNRLLSLVDDSMTQFQKAVIIHDRLVLDCEYDNNTITAYDAIVKHKSNCQGYTAAYVYLMSLLGIDCEVVQSIDMSHEWCTICIDGSYYHADLAWDDPIPDKKGHAGHRYFMLSDSAMSSSVGEHYGFEDAYYKCNDTRYDNLFMHDVDSKFCYNGKDFYVFCNNYKNSKRKSLLRYNPETEHMSVLKQYNNVWRSGESSYWANTFTSLEMYGDVLYYNMPNEVIMYDTLSGYEYILPTDVNLTGLESFYGLIIKDDALYVSVSASPNVTQNYVYVGKCEKAPFDIGKTQTVVLTKNKRVNIIFGDSIGGGKVTIMDVTLIQKHLANLENLTEAQSVSSDVNRDRNVDIVDATEIQKYLIS